MKIIDLEGHWQLVWSAILAAAGFSVLFVLISYELWLIYFRSTWQSILVSGCTRVPSAGADSPRAQRRAPTWSLSTRRTAVGATSATCVVRNSVGDRSVTPMSADTRDKSRTLAACAIGRLCLTTTCAITCWRNTRWRVLATIAPDDRRSLVAKGARGTATTSRVRNSRRNRK